MSRKAGNRFQEDIQKSCEESNILFHNVRDVYLPPDVRKRVKLPKQTFDSLIYYKKYLFALELKSTKAKSISFDEKIIKQHQIDNLVKSSRYEGVVAGFIMNFREQKPDNSNHTFFIPIERFLEYQNIAQNGLDHTYKSKVNRASIPIDICREIGIELRSELKRVRYRYFIDELLETILIHKGLR